jgi:hypothetical protein
VETSKRRSPEHDVGGIFSLCRFVDEHEAALDYDLITRTRYTVNDIGGALSWRSLNSFIKYLGSDSALAKDLGAQTGWEKVITTNQILADIYDLLAVIASKKFIKNAKPYPRPGKAENTERKIGKGALPLAEMRKWIENRRRKNNG